MNVTQHAPSQRMMQRSPQREICARCKKVIPAFALYHRHVFEPDTRDPQGVALCGACYDRLPEAQPV